jgi:hypothetical protein
MQADEKPWLRNGNAPHNAYFVDRIRKASSGPLGPGMKFDGDCSVSSGSDPAGVVRGDLHAMYEVCAQECARGNPDLGAHAIALAVLQSDDQCDAIFGTDVKGAIVFNLWVQHKKKHSVVRQLATAKLKPQIREHISVKRREESWHYCHEIVLSHRLLASPQAYFKRSSRTRTGVCLFVYTCVYTLNWLADLALAKPRLAGQWWQRK